MTWTRIGAELLTDPRFLDLTRSQRLLHLEALVHCNAGGTDGVVRATHLRHFTDEKRAHDAARKLQDAGLWEPTEDGWLIVGFTDDQPSAEDVKRTRSFALARQHRQRQHRGGDHKYCDPKYCEKAKITRNETRDATRDAGVSHNTRPVPTGPTRRNEGEGGDGGSAPSASAGAPASGTRPPEGFKTTKTDKHTEIAHMPGES
jgi:hypothetical protein